MNFKTPSVLIIGTVWPEPKSSAAGTRMIQLIGSFIDNGFAVSFASSASDSPHMVDLSAMGVNRIPVKLNDSSFDEMISQSQPEIVLFDRFMTEEQFGWRVHENSPQSVRILDTEDLHCLRYARQNAHKSGRIFNTTDLLNEDIAIREIASIYRCDLSLIISEFEMEILQKTFSVSADILHYVPYMLKPSDFKSAPDFASRKHFVTIGNFMHEPNFDSVKYLKESVWPKIRSLDKNVEMHVFGSYPSQKVHQLHCPTEKFFIQGRAEDQFEVLSNARVCLSPLRFGAGLKGKLIDAMLCGTPSITTPIGAEGIHGDCDWPGLIADEPEALATSALSLYHNDDLWTKSVKSGEEIIKNRFQYDVHSNQLHRRIDGLKSSLASHRTHNFIGKMLLHNTVSATKYMSKWIEAKNKP
jgi:glycosyltransferase involved in cell wall biosynthesis